MGDDLGDLLSDHYRRAAKDIEPDARFLDRCRNAGRPARMLLVRPGLLAAAAVVVALAALLTVGLLRPGHRDVPVAPPPSRPGPAPADSVTPAPTETSRPPDRRPPDSRWSSPTPSPQISSSARTASASTMR